MKTSNVFTKLVVAAILTIGTPVLALAEAADGKAVVRTVRGEAEFSVPGAELKVLRIGKVLTSGATIKTRPNSQTDLFLGENGPVLRLTSETTLALNTLKLDRVGQDVITETRLELKAGTIQGSVKKSAPGSICEIKTPSTICKIQGGEYRISADGKHTAVTGSLVVTYTDAQGVVTSKTVSEGETFVPPSTKGNPR